MGKGTLSTRAVAAKLTDSANRVWSLSVVDGVRYSSSRVSGNGFRSATAKAIAFIDFGTQPAAAPLSGATVSTAAPPQPWARFHDGKGWQSTNQTSSPHEVDLICQSPALVDTVDELIGSESSAVLI